MKALLPIFLLITMVVNVNGQGAVEKLDHIIYTTPQPNQFWNDQKKEYEYDQNGNVTRITNYSWENNAWQNGGKTELTYNVNNRLTEWIEYQWNSTTNNWEADQKHVNSYDGFGNIGAETVYSWFNDEWNTYYREAFSYDLNNNMTERLWQYYNNGQWDDDNRFTYSYDANDNLVEDLYCWYYGGVWTCDGKTEYYPDANGLLLEYQGFVWDSIQHEGWGWHWPKRTILNYNGNDNLDELEFHYWNGSGWVLQYEYDYSYDPSVLISDIYYGGPKHDWNYYAPDSYQYFTNKITSYVSTSYDFFLQSHNATYYYSTVVGADEQLAETELSIYPNPSSEWVYLEVNSVSSTFSLFDESGKLVKEEMLASGANRVSINGLGTGIYYYQVSDNKVLNSGKLVIR